MSASDLERLVAEPTAAAREIAHLTVLGSGVGGREVAPPLAPAAGPPDVKPPTL